MRLQDVRIRNFRSIESQELSFGELTVLFGKNDSGKTNVVKALEFAFDRSRQLDISNVHVSSAHPDPKKTLVTVDLRFVGSIAEDRPWYLGFGADAFNTEADDKISLSFRTEAAYNPDSRTFEKTRRIIVDWYDKVTDLHSLPLGLLDAFDFVLLDAHRDIAEVLRDRYSRWNQEVRKASISDFDTIEIENNLVELGAKIVKASPFLTAAENDLKGATDHRANKVEIAPVARNLNELYRSLDVLVTEDNGPSISVSLFGAGTRSRAEFMAFKALIDIAKRDAENNKLPYYCLVVFEEPEAHIHPQSQQQLLVELQKLGSQRVITTHSPFLLAKAPMNSLTHVKREGGVTCLTPMIIDMTGEQRKETERYLLRTHGELLFADVLVLAEGETEEQALPIFFERWYGIKPFECGVTFVTCGGSNYAPYIRIADRLGIPWFIFSDAETDVLERVKRQVGNALAKDISILSDCPQIVTCGLGNDYEADLIADGYAQEMLKAIRSYDYNYREQTENERGKKAAKSFDSWRRRTNGQRKKGGDRYEYDGPEGEIRALRDYMDIYENKTCYATPIAEEIVSIDDEQRCVPSNIRTLFKRLDAVLHHYEDETHD